MKSWRTRARSLLSGAYRFGGGMYLHEVLARAAGQQFLTILLFHRVTDAIPEDGLTVSTCRFGRICGLLKSRFRVVPLGEVFRVLRAGEPMPRRTLAVTFDDCYRDNLAAARVLADHGLPATFFVPTGYVGTGRVFDWDRGLPAMPNLTWDEVRAIARLGFEIGSHTVDHADLGAVAIDRAREEIFGSRQALQERIGGPVRWFAYPFGGPHHLRPEYVPLIREAGYEGAVSAFNGFVRPGIDDRVLPREAVPYFHSLLHLEMHLSGCLHWLYSLRGRQGSAVGRGPWPRDEPHEPAAGAAGLCPTTAKR
jgi:peptidoglycan/xylan/chitin deacetylase (PgdA/CDA1 family)